MAFRYERQIRDAIGSAPDLSENQLTDVSEWRDLPDDASITFGKSKSILRPGTNHIVVPNAPSLRRAFKEFEAIGEVVLPDDYSIDDEVNHEAEHGFAAARLGAQSVKYALGIWRYEGNLAFQMSALIYRVPTVKLGAAAMLAYPKVPSEGDKAYLYGLGYAEGVREVGARIEIFNSTATSRESLPLPLSYKRK